MLRITDPEYVLMKTYIEEHCGVHLEEDKEYLIESRLSDLVAASGCRSFQEFHFKARTDLSGRLRDQIVDAMTTNETSWFRDKGAWEYLAEVAAPDLLDRAAEAGGAQVWSAAASTGQEPYSLAMLLEEEALRRGRPSLAARVEIMATDISTSALLTAMAGRYDAIAMNRGLAEERRERYFVREGRSWVLDPRIRERVSFKKFNLQNPFIFARPFDLVLCRYVSIYFSEGFKRDLFAKTASVLRPGGVLLLGATESLREFSREFEISYYKNAVINTRRSAPARTDAFLSGGFDRLKNTEDFKRTR